LDFFLFRSKGALEDVSMRSSRTFSWEMDKRGREKGREREREGGREEGREGGRTEKET